ncbi:hypothetical protein VNG_0032H [Halobacterium salinarum NRC-1]|uniref:Uncharacterized protein n=3 Tax=Halobacterium salinarum TaxID=2242 RepID=Q9HSX8_HALSA|nr:hypothetical protein [Halobacterium salinarum]AAG18672.1 hypothetical protein VNG_0032H [Halobacterium salinarum NRC-1]MBB6091000.1 hypothetical protein [Halobacterium salinarum]UEB92084.1 hypothetical protein LJ422_00145 [Halobacterium salinarum NRC-34001]CAP12912.1 uncharacterized protein OE_1054F [Halobacterium salinarum R1]DAC77359.1 TPA_inf: uncharacterized protein VNG_0032H [Halobacterium salinarum NRC-1]
MVNQTATEEPTTGTVTISQDDELRVNADIYQSQFTATEYVRLGTHQDLDLIFVRPVDINAEDPLNEITEYAYKIDDTGYTGEVSCRRFLQQHNYHHTTTTQYTAEWWPNTDALCVDLTDPVEPTEKL